MDEEIALKRIRKQAREHVEQNFKLENSEDFVRSLRAEEWRITDPYTAEQREQLVECLYRFVELTATLEQIMKAFDRESVLQSLGFETIRDFVKQNTSRTYAFRTQKPSEQDESDKKYHRKQQQPQTNNENSIMWFVDEEAYKDLGEPTMKLVDLLLPNETYELGNYTPKTIFQRMEGIEIPLKNENGECGLTYDTIKDTIHERRKIVLQNKLLEVFAVCLYPQFECELRYFFRGVELLCYQFYGQNTWTVW